ncbi:MAG: 2-iminoacetate synthase ThiH [Actinobacteria bacterium]|nr:MAG: 2-iminoacetate synthase ThiH [Actinomycetota bacterium]
MTSLLGEGPGAKAPDPGTAGAPGPGVPVVLESRPDGVPARTAAADLLATDLTSLGATAAHATAADVDRALQATRRGLQDFAALLSPAASHRIEEMARLAHEATVRRFGRTVHLFAPLYLSNECVSTCTYCGFSAGNDVARRTLSPAEVLAEARELVDRGFRHLLLVAGEHARVISKDYLVDCVAALAAVVPSLSLEVQVWDTATYRRLVDAGCDGLVVYQETYDRGTYGEVHLRGKKRNYDWRLAAPDRGAEAGMRRLGIGALLGLAPGWRAEAVALAAHAHALLRRWWRCELTVSLPRLRPAAGFSPANTVSDADFVQLLCALRLLLPDVGMVVSTREEPAFRDAVLPLGVTHLSAGSSTEPGGYSPAGGAGGAGGRAEPQFEVADDRSPGEVAAALRGAGYDPVWKDWQRA